jgi:hypothetical protein
MKDESGQQAGILSVELSGGELELLLFAIEGCPDERSNSGDPSCEDDCPMISSFDSMPGPSPMQAGKRLARHLSEHLRDGWIQCGLLDAGGSSTGVAPDSKTVMLVNEKLRGWCCSVGLDEEDRRSLLAAIESLPRGAWFSMPITLWRLRRKLSKAR